MNVNQLEPILWDEKLHLSGVEEIDSQHKDLVNQFNEMLVLRRSKEARKAEETSLFEENVGA